MIDEAVAKHLDLPVQGQIPGGVTGVASTTPAIAVQVSHWKVANLELPG